MFLFSGKRREFFVWRGRVSQGGMDGRGRLERTTVKSILRTGFDPASALPYRFLGSPRESKAKREKRGDRIFAGRGDITT